MLIHHLDCGTMRPPIIGRMVCHVLLVELPGRLVLVDSGFSAADLADRRRLGLSRFGLPIVSDESGTARRQIEALGLDPETVSDIVLTHLDIDHVGGIADFPEARVHVTAEEHAAAHGPTARERVRYSPAQWSHAPSWQTYAGRGDVWEHGLTAHRLDGTEGLVLVPLPGHSRGHACVGVERPDGSLVLHVGDATFDASVHVSRSADGAELERVRVLRLFEQSIAADRKAVARNHRTLAELDGLPGVTVVNAHDARLFDALTAQP